jgi:glucosamine-6-phosphate deaminase
MKTNILSDYSALCAAVADQVVEQLRSKPDSVLVFPTGNTPLGLFRELVSRTNAGEIDFNAAHIVMLDEYADLPPGDPRSLTDWLNRELLQGINIASTRVHTFDNGPEALETGITSLGGLDFVILGLGPNGHLGFNEPGSSFDSRIRRVALTPASITSNAAYWGSEDRVPREGHTLGLGTLSEARKLILMVSGGSKRNILSHMRTCKVGSNIPASILRTLQQAEIYADEQAIGTQISALPN